DGGRSGGRRRSRQWLGDRPLRDLNLGNGWLGRGAPGSLSPRGQEARRHRTGSDRPGPPPPGCGRPALGGGRGRRRIQEGAHRRAAGKGDDRHREEAGGPHGTGAGPRVTVMVVPLPTVESMSIRPSCIWTIRYTSDSPIPEPPGLVV